MNGAYDAWLLWWPTEACHLRCGHCHYTPGRRVAPPPPPPPIDVDRVLAALEATGRTFKLSFSGGGEPFLVPNLVQAAAELSRRHFLSVNTNLTSAAVASFAEAVDPSRCDFIHASCHLEELERTGLMARYLRNYHLLRERGFVVHCCAVAHPRLLPELDRYREELAREGLPLQFSFFSGEHEGRLYPQSYTPEEIDRIRRPPLLPGVLQKSLQEYVPRKYDLPELDDDLYDVLRSPRGKLCNAGFNAAFVDSDGAVWRCLRIRDSLGRIDGDLRFEAEPYICQEEFCECPLKSYDIYLRDMAADEHVRRVAPRPPRG